MTSSLPYRVPYVLWIIQTPIALIPTVGGTLLWGVADADWQDGGESIQLLTPNQDRKPKGEGCSQLQAY